jgi:hypothetical protein
VDDVRLTQYQDDVPERVEDHVPPAPRAAPLYAAVGRSAWWTMWWTGVIGMVAGLLRVANLRGRAPAVTTSARMR